MAFQEATHCRHLVAEKCLYFLTCELNLDTLHPHPDMQGFMGSRMGCYEISKVQIIFILEACGFFPNFA